MEITKKLSSPITEADKRLLNARCNLYRSLWSCHGFLTGEPNINDALDGLIVEQRTNIEQRLMESNNYIWGQIRNYASKQEYRDEQA